MFETNLKQISIDEQHMIYLQPTERGFNVFEAFKWSDENNDHITIMAPVNVNYNIINLYIQKMFKKFNKKPPSSLIAKLTLQTSLNK